MYSNLVSLYSEPLWQVTKLISGSNKSSIVHKNESIKSSGKRYSNLDNYDHNIDCGEWKINVYLFTFYIIFLAQL
jgi:hypothetical protein